MIGKTIVLKQSKTLAFGNYDSGRAASGINPPKLKKSLTFRLHVTE